MDKFGKSQPVTRVEDQRFLTGHGRYVDDIAPKDALVAHVVRASVAHAEITALDVEAARQAPGVHLVLTADDLARDGVTEGMAFNLVQNRDGTKGAAPRRPILAEGRVRFVGEPVALIVADSLMAARDAADANDIGTRTLFETIVIDEEGHWDWLDRQLATLKRMGVPAFMSIYMSGESAGE